MAYFHNHEYRHLLRQGYYQQWKQANHVDAPWWTLYQTIKEKFIAAGIETNGYSKAHTTIIAQVLGFDEAFLIDVYHGKEGA